MWLQPFPWPNITELSSGEGAEEKSIDGGAVGEVRSKTGKKSFVINMTTVLPASGRVVTPNRDLLGSAGYSLHPSRVPKRSKWQDRRIIPMDTKSVSVIV